MYGFCRLGFSPAPSTGAICVSNGLETATSMNAKNVETPPSTGTRPRDEVGRAAAVEQDRRGRRSAVSTSSQSSSEPSCPPQNAEIE